MKQEAAKAETQLNPNHLWRRRAAVFFGALALTGGSEIVYAADSTASPSAESIVARDPILVNTDRRLAKMAQKMAKITKAQTEGTKTFKRRVKGHTFTYLEASTPELGATHGNLPHAGYVQVIAFMKDKNPVPESFMTVIGAPKEFYTPNPSFEYYDEAEVLIRNPKNSNDMVLSDAFRNSHGSYTNKTYEIKNGEISLYVANRNRSISRATMVNEFNSFVGNAEKTVDFVAGNPKKKPGGQPA